MSRSTIAKVGGVSSDVLVIEVFVVRLAVASRAGGETRASDAVRADGLMMEPVPWAVS